MELRCPDSSCNPYLTLAVCLVAVLDGIENVMTPPSEISENIFSMDDKTRASKGISSLPGSLEEAVGIMLTDGLIVDTLGEHIVNQYTAGKKKEWDAYRTHVSHWEIDRYLTAY